MNKALEKWKKATQELAEAFVDEYFEEPEYWWVDDEIGGVFFVDDYFFCVDKMVEAFQLKATFEQIVEYHDLEMESVENGKVLANFRNFVKHGLTWGGEN